MSIIKACLLTLQLTCWFSSSFVPIGSRVLWRLHSSKIIDPFDNLDRDQLNSLAKIYRLDSASVSTGELRNRFRIFFNSSALETPRENIAASLQASTSSAVFGRDRGLLLSDVPVSNNTTQDAIDAAKAISTLFSMQIVEADSRSSLNGMKSVNNTGGLNSSENVNPSKRAATSALRYVSSLAKAKRLKAEKKVASTNSNIADERAEILTMTLLRNSYRWSILNEVKADIIAAANSFTRLKRVTEDLLSMKVTFLEARSSLVQQLVDYRIKVNDDNLLKDLDKALVDKRAAIDLEKENIETLEICLGVLDIEIGQLAAEQLQIEGIEQMNTSAEDMDSLLQRLEEAKETRSETVDALIRRIGKVQAVNLDMKTTDEVERGTPTTDIDLKFTTTLQNVTEIAESNVSSTDFRISKFAVDLDTRSDAELAQAAATAVGKIVLAALKGAFSVVSAPIAYVLSEEGQEVRQAGEEALQAASRAAKALSSLVATKSVSEFSSGSLQNVTTDALEGALTVANLAQVAGRRFSAVLSRPVSRSNISTEVVNETETGTAVGLPDDAKAEEPTKDLGKS